MKNTTHRRANFRADYLAALGFAGAPLQTSLEKVLLDKYVDVVKLKKICTKFEVPTHYKSTVWKILLGVLPPITEAWEFVSAQKSETYSDLKRTASLIFHGVPTPTNNDALDEDLLNQRAQTLTEVHKCHQSLLQTIWEPYTPIDQWNNQLSDVDDDYHLNDLKKICRVFVGVCNNEADAYWCFANFLSQNGKEGQNTELKIKQLRTCLREIDTELAEHFIVHQIDMEHFIFRWFRTHFASCFPESCLELLWDKLMATSAEFEVLVACHLLVSRRFQIRMQLGRDPSQLTYELRNLTISHAQASIVITRALESYFNSIERQTQQINSQLGTTNTTSV